MFKFLFGRIHALIAKRAAAAEERAEIAARREVAEEFVDQDIRSRGVFHAYDKVSFGTIGTIEVTGIHDYFLTGEELEVLCGKYDGHYPIDTLNEIDGVECEFQLQRFSSPRDLDEIAAGRRPDVLVSIITAKPMRVTALV